MVEAVLNDCGRSLGALFRMKSLDSFPDPRGRFRSAAA
jgi:hypothetical protein